MTYRNEGPFAVTAGEALEADRLVRLAGTSWMYCDAGQEPMGLVVDPVASGARVTIRPLGGACIEKFTAAKPIGVGDEVYPAADGKVSDAPAGQRIGVALTAATASGGKLSILVLPAGTGVVAKDWQESVSGRLNFVTSEPAAPSEGDRYINLNTGASSVTGQAVVATHVYEWNGTEWTDITPTEGMMLTVEDENVPYYYTGAAWTTSVPFGALAIAAAGTVALGEGANVTAGTTTGSKIGTAPGQKFGFWNAAPVVQPSHVADPAATAADPNAMTAAAAALTAADPTAMTAAAAALTAADPNAMTAAAAALTAADPTLDANDITDSTGGTPSATHALVDVATDTWDNEKADVENNFATIAAEYNALKDDVEALETSLEHGIDDLATQKGILDALITDVTSIRAKELLVLDDAIAQKAILDALITDVTSIRAKELLVLDDAIAQKAILDALIADVTSIRTQEVAVIDDVQAVNTVADSILAQLATTGMQASS